MSEAVKINIDEALEDGIKTAKKIFFEGGIFVYPTDTIYGIGANPFNADAIDKIIKLKERDLGKTFILLIGSIKSLLNYVELKSENHLDFLISLWPNPVSVILNLNSKNRELLGRENSAFRIPNNRFCSKLLSEIDLPLISTSVNKSNMPPLLEPSLIIDDFSSEVDAIFYTEKKSYFESSTIIDLTGNRPLLIREGKMKFKDLMDKYEIQRS